jgi:hypothetical protein
MRRRAATGSNSCLPAFAESEKSESSPEGPNSSSVTRGRADSDLDWLDEDPGQDLEVTFSLVVYETDEL